MQIKKHIPNAITCGNLVCGCLGIMEVFRNHLLAASLLILLACILDFFDGFVARLLHVQSPIGKELDSLADVVTFGVLPGFMMYHWIGFDFNQQIFVQNNWCYAALCIPVFSALRLAKFNIDTRQSEQFIGVPTPANAIFIGSLSFVFQHSYFQELFITNAGLMQGLLVFIAIGCSLLLVSEIALIALKFKSFAWKGNEARYSLIIGSVLLLLFLQMMALPLIIIGYVALSLVAKKG